jgi:hypothetical protein
LLSVIVPQDPSVLAGFAKPRHLGKIPFSMNRESEFRQVSTVVVFGSFGFRRTEPAMIPMLQSGDHWVERAKEESRGQYLFCSDWAIVVVPEELEFALVFTDSRTFGQS